MTATARRRRTVQGGRRPAGLLGSRRFGRRLFAAMTIVAATYGAIVLYTVVHAARTFGALYPGMTPAEVRYVLGAPDTAGSLWQVRDGDTATSLLFGADGLLAAAGCRGVRGGGGSACPDVLGLHIGDDEDAVWRRLGVPTGEGFGGVSKVMAYPELGVRFQLRRGTIVAIEHRHWQGAAALAARTLTLLAP